MKRTLKLAIPNAIQRFFNNNLGLHCHCAEDKKHLLDLLARAKAEHVSYLIINNYKSLKIYSEILAQLTPDELRPYAGIKLIPSVELPGSFEFTNLSGDTYNIELHILAYGVDLDKEETLQKFVNSQYRSLNQAEELQRLIKIGHSLGLNFANEDAYLDPNDDNRKFAGRAFMQALMKNMDDNFCQEGEISTTKLPYELRTNWRAFQNRCVKDRNNPFFLDVAALNPDVNEVIHLIHQLGGKAYLGHPSAYFAKVGTPEDIDLAFQNSIKLVKDFLHKYSPRNNPHNYIDGGEVYHPSYLGNFDIISEMKTLVKAHQIGSSGGTDIHVDKTTGDNETVSSDSLNGNVNKNKLRKFRMLRKKAIPIQKLRQQIIESSYTR